MHLVASTAWSSQLTSKMRLFLAENSLQTEYGEFLRSPIFLAAQRMAMRQGARADNARISPTPQKLSSATSKVKCDSTALCAKDSLGDPAVRRLVIIGSGIAGIAAARQARYLHPGCAIHLISQDKQLLHKQASRAGRFLQQDQWCREQRITRWANTYAAEIDADKRRVLLDTDRYLGYDRLIMANDSSAQDRPIAGFGTSGTFVLREPGDTADLHRFIERHHCRKVTVASASLLGLEAAYALQKMGLTVSLLLTADGILNRQFDARSRSLLQRYTELQGIEILSGVSARPLICDDMNRVRAVRLSDGSELKTDVFLECIDAQPDVSLAKVAGIATRYGLLVDDYMQTSQADIYAAGDVAEHDGSTSSVRALAVVQGEIAACNALGGRRRYSGHMRSTLFKAREIDLLSVGQINADGKGMCAIVSEHPERFKYRKLILASGYLLGAILIGYPDDAALISGLVERSANLTRLLPALQRGNWDVLAQLKIPA